MNEEGLPIEPLDEFLVSSIRAYSIASCLAIRHMNSALQACTNFGIHSQQNNVHSQRQSTMRSYHGKDPVNSDPNYPSNIGQQLR